METDLTVERESHLNSNLPVADLSIFYMSPSFEDLKPAKIAQAPGRFGKRVFYCIFDAVRRGAHKFNLLVDMIAHVSKNNPAASLTTI